jgi:hypothetical protein
MSELVPFFRVYIFFGTFLPFFEQFGDFDDFLVDLVPKWPFLSQMVPFWTPGVFWHFFTKMVLFPLF